MYHVDFVKCRDILIGDCIKKQWSDIVKPGKKVKVKLKLADGSGSSIYSAVVQECMFLSCLSLDCLYSYATAKSLVRLLDSDSESVREFQFRVICYCNNYN